MLKRVPIILGVLLAVMLAACQDPIPTPEPTSTPTPTATPAPTATPTVSPGTAAYNAFIDQAPVDLSAATGTCLMELFEEDPSFAESFTSEEDLSGPAMLSLLACLTPEEAAALTPSGEDPPPDVAGLACLTEELEGAPEKDRILAVLSGADTSGEGLTLAESAALGEAVEACGIDTGFSFPGEDGAVHMAMLEELEEATGVLSAETRACLMELFKEDPSFAESFTAGEDLSGPAMLSLLACLTPEEAAALTPSGEDPPPDVAGLACLTEELEGAPEKDRILAVLSGADTSGEGLTLAESAVLGEAVEACGIDTGFGFVSDGGQGHPLAGTEWRLVALGDAGAPAEVVGGDPTARFTTDVDMTGWTGCNSYGARYSVRGSELRLDDLQWQEAGCPSDALFQQEQRMQDSLATVERFEISGERLTIHSEGGQALVFERAGE